MSSLFNFMESLPPASDDRDDTPSSPASGALDDDEVELSYMKPRLGWTIEEAKEALNGVPADDRDVWMKVGMGLYHEFKGSEEAFALWDSWSATADNYGGVEWYRWEGFRAAPDRDPITARYIRYQAEKLRPDTVAHSAGATGEARHWSAPEAIPNGLPDVTPFDYELLPESLRPWVQDVADRMQCPPDFVAVAAMVAISAVVRNQVVVAPKQRDPWRVSLTLWALAVGKPGVMKSPAMGEAYKAVQRLEMAARDQFQKDVDERDRLERAQKMIRTESERLLKKRAGELTAEGLAAEMGKLDAELSDPPAQVRYTTDNVTPEALIELLKQNPLGLTIWRDEVAGFLKMAAKEGSEELTSLMLSGFDGDRSYQLDRIKRGTGHFVQNVWLSFIGSIQPGVLQQYVAPAIDGTSGDNGLIQRFGMMVYPDVPKDWRNVDRAADPFAKDALYDLTKRLSNLPMAIDPQTGKEVPAVLRFAPDAQTAANQFRIELEHRLRYGDNHPAIDSHLSKYRKLMPTIAGLLALADGATETIPIGPTEKAIRWCAYLETHAMRVYQSGMHTEFDTARLIVKRIESGDLPGCFTAREVYRRKWSGLKDPKGVQAALEVLEVHGWVREIDTGNRGGRPTLAYVAHPDLLTQPEVAP